MRSVRNPLVAKEDPYADYCLCRPSSEPGNQAKTGNLYRHAELDAELFRHRFFQKDYCPPNESAECIACIEIMDCSATEGKQHA